jgi:signal peptidase II
MSDDSTEHSPSVELESVDESSETSPTPAAASSDRPPVNKLRLILLLATVILVADQLTKSWAVASLANEPPTHVIWTLQWNLSFNSGMAFSQAQGIGPIIGVIATLVIIGLALSLRKIDHRLALTAAGLIIGGAIGNLIDRLFRDDGWMHGSVVDFIDFQWFPIFNVADSAITIGGILFAMWSLFSPQAPRR